jgi:two-component system, OmpR family, sensor kinase
VRLAGAPAGGSGLGLAIVRGVAEHHGGEVVLLDGDGPPGRPGLRVRVSLPSGPAGTAQRTPRR